MIVYADLVFLLNFTVDYLLLHSANRLAGFQTRHTHAVLAALAGGIYGALCLLDGFAFLGNGFFRLLSLFSISVIAFGWNKSAFSRGILFSFLSMALGGIAISLHSINFITILLCAVVAMLLCYLGFRGNAGQKAYVKIDLRQGNRSKSITALRDTGNALTDPISGCPVIVVGPELALEFMGFSQSELLTPVETIAKRASVGLRLIPYRSVGKNFGMLLAMKFDEVRIDGRLSDDLIAFAPDMIGKGEIYEALAGGAI